MGTLPHSWNISPSSGATLFFWVLGWKETRLGCGHYFLEKLALGVLASLSSLICGEILDMILERGFDLYDFGLGFFDRA